MNLTEEQQRVKERFPHGAARAAVSNWEWVALSELEKWGFEDAVHEGEYRPLDVLLDDSLFCAEYGREEPKP